MGNASKNVGSVWWPALKRVAQLASLVALAVATFAVLGTFVLWDADNFSARQRLERIRHAWFGDWLTAEDFAQEVATDSELIAALNRVEGLSLFLQSSIEPGGLVVTTGASFATSQNVIAGIAENQWCYLTIGSGQVSKRLTLADQDGDTAPVFQSLDDISQSDLSQIGLDALALGLAARAHCRFDEFSQSTPTRN